MGMMLTLRASIRLWTGRSADAIEPAEESVEKFRSMGDWYGQLMSMGTLGRSLVMQGRFDDGFAVIDEALHVAEGTQSSNAPQIAITQLVTSAAQAGRPDRVDDVDTSFARSHVAGEVGFTDCLVGDGLLHLQRGDAAAGRQLLETVVDNLGEAASGYSLSALALARAASGDVEGAFGAAEAAGTYSATYSDRASAATATALAAARAGDAERAATALGEVKDILAATDDRNSRNLLSLASATVDLALGKAVSPGAGAEAAAASPGWVVAYRLAAGL
jgi:hypothetical protein